MILVSDVDLDLLNELHTYGSVRNLKDRRSDVYEVRLKNKTVAQNSPQITRIGTDYSYWIISIKNESFNLQSVKVRVICGKRVLIYSRFTPSRKYRFRGY